MDKIISDLKSDLKRLVETLHQDILGVRGNRPTSKLVEDIKVECYGQIMPLKSMGSISIVPPREINISIWDTSVVAAVAKAIESSGIGMSANIDGNLIRLNMPQLTNERRQELVKLVKKMAEEAKIKVRSYRDDANKKTDQLEKGGEISEDQKFKTREGIQKGVDEANDSIESLLSSKVRELEEI